MNKFNKKGYEKVEILKISSKSKAQKLAGALSNIIRKEDTVEMQAVGAGALNQGIKAVIIAKGYLAPSGIDLVVCPSFVDIKIEDQEKTAIKLLVTKK